MYTLKKGITIIPLIFFWHLANKKSFLWFILRQKVTSTWFMHLSGFYITKPCIVISESSEELETM